MLESRRLSWTHRLSWMILAAVILLAVAATVWRFTDRSSHARPIHPACEPFIASIPQYDPGFPPDGWVRAFTLEYDGRRFGYGPILGHYWRPLDEPGEPQLCGLHYNTDFAYGSQAPDGLLLYTVHGFFAPLAGVGENQVPQPPPDEWTVFRYAEDFPQAAIEPVGGAGYVYWYGAYDPAARRATAYGFWLQHTAVTSFRFDLGQDEHVHAMHAYPYTRDVVPGIDEEYAPRLIFDAGPRPLQP